MPFFEDFSQKYGHTYFLVGGIPFFLEAVGPCSPGQPQTMNDLLFIGSFVKNGSFKHKTQFNVAGNNIVFPELKSCMVNTKEHASWHCKIPERQWHKGMCKGNTAFYHMGSYELMVEALSYIRNLPVKTPGINSPKIPFEETAEAILMHREYPTFDSVYSDTKSGKILSRAFDRHYALGVGYPTTSPTLYRKFYPIGEVLDRNRIALHSPLFQQEVTDLAKRQKLYWTVSA